MRQLVVSCLVACLLAAALTEAKPSGRKRGGRRGPKGERGAKHGGLALFCLDDAVCPKGTVCKSWDIEGLSVVYNGADVTIRSCRPENDTMEAARPESRLESESSEEDKPRLPRPVMGLLRSACSVDGKVKECCENCTVGPIEITFGNATLEVFYCGSGDFDAVDTLNADQCRSAGEKGSSSESDESDESSGSVESSEEAAFAPRRGRPSRLFSGLMARRGYRRRNGRSASDESSGESSGSVESTEKSSGSLESSEEFVRLSKRPRRPSTNTRPLSNDSRRPRRN